MPDIPLRSCEEGQPLVELEEGGQPARLRYDVPASTAIRTKGFIPLGYPTDYFKEEYRTAPPPEENPWPPVDPTPGPDEPPSTGVSEIPPERRWQPTQPFDPGPLEHGIAWTPKLDLISKSFSGFDALKALTLKTQVTTVPAQEPETGAPRELATFDRILEFGIARPTLEEIDRNLQARRLPLFGSTLWGAPVVNYVAEPKAEEVTPRLFIIEHYVSASYLRDYGAGRTIKTFSLLPGEKTTISIRSFRQTTELRSKTENVLDSYSEKSADEFEQMLQSEVGKHQSSSDKASSMVSATDTDTYGGGGNAGVNLGIVSIGGEASGSSTNTEKSERTTSSARESAVDSSSKALDRHVAQSSAARDVEIKTESQQSATAKAEDEETTVRTLENINHSRVLNFVFRQLAQQYVTVTYLAEVQIGFANGYPNRTRIERLDNLNGLLEDVLEEEHVAKVRKDILREVNSIPDKDGTLTQFIEKVQGQMVDPETGEQIQREPYWRKRRDLEQEVEEIGVKAPGVVLDVSERILQTDAVVVEALLGQAEALDCYNQRLQDAAGTRADLENQERAQAIEIIGEIPDAVAKAEAYKSVFGNCCPTPQTVLDGGGDA